MSRLIDRFRTAILSGDFPAALAVAREARELGLPVLYEQVAAPALVQVGELWQQGRISVADEHIASALTQSVLASFYPSFVWAVTGPKGIVACVPGERHELGARMAADLIANDGWNLIYVGSDVPLEALLTRVVHEDPVFVGLSVGMPERLPAVREAIARLRVAAPHCKLVIGGRAVATEGALALGADLTASSASGAVEAIRRWKR